MTSKYRKIKGIEGLVSVFNQELHDKYDIGARNAINEILKDGIIDNPDKYGVDMIFTNNNLKYKYLELQVCTEWEYEFPYKFPFVYARKMRYANDTLYLTFDKNYKKCLIFDRQSIIEKPERLKKYSREFVNLIPWHKVLKVNICDLDMDTIINF
jgi:hypothetical protein